MKRLIGTLCAVLALSGPLADAAHAQNGRWKDRGERSENRGQARKAERERYQERRAPEARRYDRENRGRGGGYAPRRGAYLPDTYRGSALGDPGRYRLRPPPRGYSWYSVGRSYVLVDQYTGQVLDVID